MQKKFVDLLKEEVKRLDGMVYFSKPYSCATEEALSYFNGYDMPKPGMMTIEREETNTTISIKPMKGSGKRKLYVIRMWVAFRR